MDEPHLDRLERAGVAPHAIEAANTRSIPVLARALAVLELVAASPNGLTLPEVARKLLIPKSTAHCILLTLLRQEYLIRSSRTRRFVLGHKLFLIANQALEGQNVREAAMPHLRHLMLATKLTVHMAIFERGEAIVVAKVDPPGVTNLATWLGRRLDVHCTGVGKALAAFLPPGELKELLNNRAFPRHNENTIVSAKRLLQELEGVRASGYATDDEEDEIGYRCVGVPIFDEQGRLAAAISLAGSTSQVTSENMKALVQQLRKTSEAIQDSLRRNQAGGER